MVGCEWVDYDFVSAASGDAGMSSVWEKLFGNGSPPANDSPHSIRYGSGGDTQLAKPAATIGSLGAIASGGQGQNGEAMPKSQKVARTFDSIGRRNESLRAQLDAVEFSFRNIETIRAQFYDALTPIDQTLVEIERTKLAHLEAERKLEALTDAHDRLRGEHATLTLDRSALAAKNDEFSGRIKDLERAIAAAEAASSEARAALADRTAKLERNERELEDNRRRLHTVSEQLPALRAEFAAKEKRLQEVEQHRANLQDQHDLLTEESQSLRNRIEELVASGSKLNRQLSELETRRSETAQRVDELEAALNQEAGAHAKLRAAHLDAAEQHRLVASTLREEVSAMYARSEGAERLLAAARAELRERDAAIRGFEQRALETSLAAKAKETALADLEKDLASVRAAHSEVDLGARVPGPAINRTRQGLGGQGRRLSTRRTADRGARSEDRRADQGEPRRARAARGEDQQAQGAARGRIGHSRFCGRGSAIGASGTRSPAPRGRGPCPSAKEPPPAQGGQGESAREKITRLRG